MLKKWTARGLSPMKASCTVSHLGRTLTRICFDYITMTAGLICAILTTLILGL